jgi:hypothetical protein
MLPADRRVGCDLFLLLPSFLAKISVGLDWSIPDVGMDGWITARLISSYRCCSLFARRAVKRKQQQPRPPTSAVRLRLRRPAQRRIDRGCEFLL